MEGVVLMVFELFGISGYLILGVAFGLVAIIAFLLSVTRKKSANPSEKDWRKILLSVGIFYIVLYLFRNIIDDLIGVTIPSPSALLVVALLIAGVILIYRIVSQKSLDFDAKQIAIYFFLFIIVIAGIILVPDIFPQEFSVVSSPAREIISTTTQSVMSVMGLG
jgi:hypothetical protein